MLYEPYITATWIYLSCCGCYCHGSVGWLYRRRPRRRAQSVVLPEGITLVPQVLKLFPSLNPHTGQLINLSVLLREVFECPVREQAIDSAIPNADL